MKVQQTLYKVTWSDESRPKLERWRVSSIRRKARPYHRPLQGERRAYLQLCCPPKWLQQNLRRDSFPIEDWPNNVRYCASELAAWRTALPRIEREIQLTEEMYQEAVDAKEDEEELAEWKSALRQLRTNRTVIKKNAQ